MGDDRKGRRGHGGSRARPIPAHADAGQRVAVSAALVLGLVVLVAGASGFLTTGLQGWSDPDGVALFGVMRTNPAHNVVLLVMGGGLITGALTGKRRARLVLVLAAAVWVLLAGIALVARGGNGLALDRTTGLVLGALAALALAAALRSRQVDGRRVGTGALTLETAMRPPGTDDRSTR